jgi:hypothetical protein
MMGAGFWAMIAFSVLCVIGGAAIVAFGPKFLSPKPAPGPPAAVAPPAPSVPPNAETPAAAALEPPSEPTEGADVEIGRLNERVAALEQRETRVSQAAAVALAAAGLVEASQSSRPFTEELTTLESVSPPSADLRSLRQLADQGAPSRAALAASFPDYAARAASAGRAPGEGAGLLARAVYALSRVVSLRRVGDVPGAGVDATLARAERLVEDGDLDRALRTLDALPAASRDSFAPWRARAERRAEIDRRVSAVRTEALEALARNTRGGA